MSSDLVKKLHWLLGNIMAMLNAKLSCSICIKSGDSFLIIGCLRRSVINALGGEKSREQCCCCCVSTSCVTLVRLIQHHPCHLLPSSSESHLSPPCSCNLPGGCVQSATGLHFRVNYSSRFVLWGRNLLITGTGSQRSDVTQLRPRQAGITTSEWWVHNHISLKDTVTSLRKSHPTAVCRGYGGWNTEECVCLSLSLRITLIFPNTACLYAQIKKKWENGCFAQKYWKDFLS